MIQIRDKSSPTSYGFFFRSQGHREGFLGDVFHLVDFVLDCVTSKVANWIDVEGWESKKSSSSILAAPSTEACTATRLCESSAGYLGRWESETIKPVKNVHDLHLHTQIQNQSRHRSVGTLHLRCFYRFIVARGEGEKYTWKKRLSSFHYLVESKYI